MDQSKYIPPVAKQTAGEPQRVANGRKPWKTERKRNSAKTSKKQDWILLNQQVYSD